MPYGQDLAGSARRHLAAAHRLYDADLAGHGPGSKAVAGYLYGLAGELALKQIMRESGMQPLDGTQRRDDPFYAHFPTLRILLRDKAEGRRAAELRRYADNNALFQDWDTGMRYAPTSDIDQRWTERWKSQAETLVADMGL